jgi:hypothetical protein
VFQDRSRGKLSSVSSQCLNEVRRILMAKGSTKKMRFCVTEVFFYSLQKAPCICARFMLLSFSCYRFLSFFLSLLLVCRSSLGSGKPQATPFSRVQRTGSWRQSTPPQMLAGGKSARVTMSHGVVYRCVWSRRWRSLICLQRGSLLV